MSSMGGNLGLYGDMSLLNIAPHQAAQASPSMAGVGMDPEGIDNNPVYWQLLLDSAWRSQPLADVSSFLQSWGARRCGGPPGKDGSWKARQAWALLAETVYAGSAAQHYEHHMAYCPTSIFGGGTWDRSPGAHGSEHPGWYNTSTLYTAWGLLIDAAKSECGDAPLSKALIFDLVDVGREYLSIVPCRAASSALSGAKTSASVVAANSSMTEFMADLDRLLGASDGFLLGQWVSDARSLATTAGASRHGADFLEWNARSQVTSWIPSERCDGKATALNVLYDYGNKMWSGLVKGYYDRRYQIYAQSKSCAISPGAAECEGFTFTGQLMKLACEFQHQTNVSELSATAVGDAIAISEELFKKYAPS